MKKINFLAFLALFAINFCFANECVDFSKVNFKFANKSEGCELLKSEDEFTNNLSEFDMSSRLKTSRNVSKEEYLNFICQQSLDWSEEEVSFLNKVFNDINKLTPVQNV